MNTNIYAGIKYASSISADVTNASFNIVNSCEQRPYTVNPSSNASIQPRTWDEMFEDADAVGNTVVVGAGNNGTNLTQAQSCENAIIVSATFTSLDAYPESTYTDGLRYSSSYGVGVDVTAPGKIRTATYMWNSSTTTFGPYDPNWTEANRASYYDYGVGSATSIAGPQVAGVVALLKAVDPSLTVSQLKTLLRSTGEDISAANPSENPADVPPMVNAYEALCSLSSITCAPEQVDGFVITNVGSVGSAPHLQWEASQGPLADYTVQRASYFTGGSVGPYSDIATVTGTTYTDNSATIGDKFDSQKWYYRIIANGNNGTTAPPSSPRDVWAGEEGGPGGGALKAGPEEEQFGVPTETRLLGAAPTPASGLTHIAFDLNEDADVSITLHNTMGQVVWESGSSAVQAGSVRLPVNVSGFASGLYLVRMSVPSQGVVMTKALTVTR